MNLKYENYYGITNTCSHLGVTTDASEAIFVYGKSKEECYKFLDEYLSRNPINKNVWIYNVGGKPHRPVPTHVYILEVHFLDTNASILFSYLYRKKKDM